MCIILQPNYESYYLFHILLFRQMEFTLDRCLKIVTVFFPLLLSISFMAGAATPSPAMMAQFKNLPRAEQLKLAKKYGLNVAEDKQNSFSQPSVSAEQESFEENLNDDYSLQKEKKELDDDDNPKRFGLSMFDTKQKNFGLSDSSPVPNSYVLGPNDQLLLQVFGKVSMTEELLVARDGTISIPEVGVLSVAGLNFSDAVKLITERVKTRIIGVDVAVSMGKIRTISVTVAGEANRPGSYSVPALLSVTQMLTYAGGVSDIGSLRNIKIQRSNGENLSFDLYDLLLRGDAKSDLNLQNGDVLFVPPYGALVEVKGQVLRPALYEITQQDSLKSLIQMAGGEKAEAFLRDVTISRINQDGSRQLLQIDLTSSDSPNTKIINGDVLSIGQVSNRTEKQVVLVGAVARPGFYAFYEGMRVNNLISSLWNDLKVNADLDYSLVVSRNPQTNKIKVRQFHLGQAINNPLSEHNLVLNSQDVIYVVPFSKDFNRDALDKKLYAEYQEAVVSKRPKIEEVKNTDASGPLGANTVRPDIVAVEQNFASSAFDALLLTDKKNEIENVGKQNLNRTEPNVNSLRIPEKDKAYVVDITRKFLVKATRSHEYIEYSTYLNRRELLYSLLEEIRRQVNPNGELGIVSVFGEVRYPGYYPLAENSKLKDLVVASGGLLPSAFLENSELTSSVITELGAVSIEHKNVSLTSELVGSQQTLLRSRDRLNVFKFSDWDAEHKIQLTGQVRFPGEFAIRSGETLADVLKRAGGLSTNAFPKGAVFIRQQIKMQEGQQLRLLTQQLRKDIAARTLSSESAAVSVQDSLIMLNEIEKSQPVGRIVIDIESILSGREDFNFPVEDGDELFIPMKKTYVSVIGEVQYPSSHRYVSGLSFDDYLRLAGGVRKRADVDSVYVIRADGSVLIPQTDAWFAVSENQMMPGDTIVIPLDTEFKDSLSLWTQVTQIFYQSAVALAALNSF
jgi:polysaccharide export outer membrane protein